MVADVREQFPGLQYYTGTLNVIFSPKDMTKYLSSDFYIVRSLLRIYKMLIFLSHFIQFSYSCVVTIKTTFLFSCALLPFYSFVISNLEQL